MTMILSNYSCAHTVSSDSSVLPRESFVHLNKSLRVYSCDENNCNASTPINLRASASGFIVRITSEGSFIITAAHFCENNMFDIENNIKVVTSYVSKRLDGEAYSARMLDYQSDIDVCMLYAAGLTSNISAVRLSNSRPEPGDKIYNIAAPFSIVASNMVPILEGRYNGKSQNNDFYTLPAAPGSSGSMIINEYGELIGMVHSVFIRFNVISLSTKYEDLMKFISDKLHKYTNDSSGMKSLNVTSPVPL